jgi:hypothetical protein
MLAPRKTLWSTPSEVMEQVVEWMPLSGEDVVCDVGCGDGRCLVQWATHYTTTATLDGNDDNRAKLASFVGLDIDAARITEAQQAWETAVAQGQVNARIRADFYCVNALEAVALWKDATVLFLYLIPRGLRRIKSLLLDHGELDHVVRIVTYMSPFPGERPVRQERVKVAHQPNAAWPLFAYRLEPASTSVKQEEEAHSSATNTS